MDPAMSGLLAGRNRHRTQVLKFEISQNHNITIDQTDTHVIPPIWMKRPQHNRTGSHDSTEVIWSRGVLRWLFTTNKNGIFTPLLIEFLIEETDSIVPGNMQRLNRQKPREHYLNS